MGALLNFNIQQELLEGAACCGITFSMPADFVRKRREDHKRFFCPNGHELSFNGPSKAEQLQKELDAAKAEQTRLQLNLEASRKQARDEAKSRDRAELTLKQVKGKTKALKARVKNGVCPCCKRSFVALAKHMATQHPMFNEETHGEASKDA